jgi:hypothetical protein
LLTGGPLRPYPGRSFHRLDGTSFCWRLRKSRLAANREAKRYRVTVAAKSKEQKKGRSRLQEAQV